MLDVPTFIAASSSVRSLLLNQAEVVMAAPVQTNSPNGSKFDTFPLYAGMKTAEVSHRWVFPLVFAAQCPAVQISFSLLGPLAEATDVAEQT